MTPGKVLAHHDRSPLMPRYVVLHHVLPTDSQRPSHFDLMLEESGALLTWAIPAPPTPGATLIAESLADHRLAYLEFEGEISDNRGAVTRWDSGTYEILTRDENSLKLWLAGNKLNGTVTITRDDPPSAAWTLVYHPLPPRAGRVRGR